MNAREGRGSRGKEEGGHEFKAPGERGQDVQSPTGGGVSLKEREQRASVNVRGVWRNGASAAISVRRRRRRPRRTGGVIDFCFIHFPDIFTAFISSVRPLFIRHKREGLIEGKIDVF